MAVSINTEGSQTAVISTEHTLATITSAGTYVLAVDLANLANGDVLELRVYTKLTSGDTSQLTYFATYANVQADKNVLSVPVPAPIEFKATLKQTAGTGRAFIWAVYQL
jgi:hypothetical protein